MAVVTATDIAVMGMRSQRLRMNLISNNVANAMTTRTPEGGPFRRQIALFEGKLMGSALDESKFGVNVRRIVDDPSPFRNVFEPAHPDANDEGYVSYPNVNLAVEMVNLISAQRAYEANVNVVLAGRQMTNKATEIIQV